MNVNGWPFSILFSLTKMHDFVHYRGSRLARVKVTHRGFGATPQLGLQSHNNSKKQIKYKRNLTTSKSGHFNAISQIMTIKITADTSLVHDYKVLINDSWVFCSYSNENGRIIGRQNSFLSKVAPSIESLKVQAKWHTSVSQSFE